MGLLVQVSVYPFIHPFIHLFTQHIFGMLIICQESGSWKYNSKQSLCSPDSYILVYSRQINTFWLLLNPVKENQAGGGGKRGWRERRVYLC